MPTATLKNAMDLFLEGSLVFARMEHNGLKIDENYMDGAVAKLSRKIKRLEEKLRSDDVFKTWRKRFGEKTKLGSRTQLATVLFDVMKLPSPGYTDATDGDDYEGERHHRTNRVALERMNLEFVKRYIRWDKADDLRSKINGVCKEIVDGYLHPDFMLQFARSFRGSSAHPNFQSIHNRDKEAAEIIRKGFVPRPGNVLIENDFAAHEFKVAASRWNDPEMIRYASDKTKDIHRDSAADLFLCKPEQVSKSMRQEAKSLFVFATIYGSFYILSAGRLWNLIQNGNVTLADGTRLDDWIHGKGIREVGDLDTKRKPRKGTYEEHVKACEDRFFGRFSVFAEQRRVQYQEYLKTGKFTYLTGFEVNGVYSRNAFYNYGIQGPAFHCLLWVAIRVQKILDKKGMKSLLVGQIHDCLLCDVPIVEIQDYLNIVKQTVEVDLPKAWSWIRAPLEIEAEVADTNWFNKKQWVEKSGVWGSKG